MPRRSSSAALVDTRCRVPETAVRARVRFESLNGDGVWCADDTVRAGNAFTSLGHLGARRRVIACWREPGRGTVFVTRAFETPAVAPSPRIVDLGVLAAPDGPVHQVRAVPDGARGLDAARARVAHRAEVELELDGPLEAPTVERVKHRVALTPGPLERFTGLAVGTYRFRIVTARAHDADATRWVVAPPTTDVATLDLCRGVLDVALAVVPGARVELVGASSSARLASVRATGLDGAVRDLAFDATGPDLDGTVHVDLPDGEWAVVCAFDAAERSGAPRRASARVLVQHGRRERAALAWDEIGDGARRSPSRRVLATAGAAFALGVVLALFAAAKFGGERPRVLVPISVALSPNVADDDAPQWLRVLAIDRTSGQVRVLHDDRTGGTLRRDVELPVGTWEVVAFAGRSSAEASVRSAMRRTFVAASRFHVRTNGAGGEDGTGAQRLELAPAALAVIDSQRPYGIDGWPAGVLDLWPRARVVDEAALVQPLLPHIEHTTADGRSRLVAGPAGSVVLAARTDADRLGRSNH